MTEEEKCYKNVDPDYELNYSCIDQNFSPGLDLTEDIKIAVHCSLNPSIWFTGVKNPPAVTSSVCPQRATSKIPIKQCYSSILVDEKT